MKPGDLVCTKTFVAQFGGAQARGSASFKPSTRGHLMHFMALGCFHPDTPAATIQAQFDALMRNFGWVPGPELQAIIDKEKADAQAADKPSPD